MKNEFTEILDFDSEIKAKVGRPKLADKDTKKKSIIFAIFSLIAVILLLIFGYGTLFGFKNINLKAALTKNENNNETIYVDEIKPLVKNITLKEGTARKVYLTVLPASATNKKIKYKSSNEDVAVVDSNGKVTGISAGRATIIATTTDGTTLTAEFKIKVVKSAAAKCNFTTITKNNDGIVYSSECKNAVVKEIQYKVGNGDYKKLLTKKLTDKIRLSTEELKKDIKLKIVYFPNNSKVAKYSTKTLKINTTRTTKSGKCTLSLKEVKSSHAKYSVRCKNAEPTKIAYKIGNGSYIGVDPSNLASTIIYEESDVTRILYFNIEYQVDGTKKKNTIIKNSIIEKKQSVTTQQ